VCPPANGSSTCSQWDALTPTCNVADVPAFCEQPWCYVDPVQCRASDVVYEKSSYYKDVAPPLFFSYHTCGGRRDYWKYFEATRRATSRMLTAVLPSAAYVPYHYKVDASGSPFSSTSEGVEVAYRDDSVAWRGALVEYFAELAASSNTALSPTGFQLTWVSQATRSAQGSAWSAAVSEVGLGLADLGISIFWLTPERLETTSFTSSLLTDLMYLFVPKPTEDTSLLTQIYKPFTPLEPSVWFAVIGIVLATGTLQIWLTSQQWWDEWAQRTGWATATNGRRARLLLSKLGEGWYSAYIAVVTGGPDVADEHRLATRLLNAGNGFFILLLLSAYTANLAAFLSVADRGTYWPNIEAAADADAKICAHTVLRAKLAVRYPQVDFHFRYMDVADDVRAAVTTDGCDAFIFAMRDMRIGGAADAVRCELGFVAVGTPVAEVDVALPASTYVSDAVSFWMSALAAQNGTTFASVQDRYAVEPQCSMVVEVATDNGGLKKLNMTNFAAPTIIVLVFMALATSTRMCDTKRTPTELWQGNAGKVGRAVNALRRLSATVGAGGGGGGGGGGAASSSDSGGDGGGSDVGGDSNGLAATVRAAGESDEAIRSIEQSLETIGEQLARLKAGDSARSGHRLAATGVASFRSSAKQAVEADAVLGGEWGVLGA